MKKYNIALNKVAILALIVSLFIACDKDFATIESDIVNSDNATHFDALSRDYDVIAYSKALPPVQTNGLPVNLLGIYNDPVYGKTTANLVTQLRPLTFDPIFGSGSGVVLDSVVITVPYFSRATEVQGNGVTIFELDSVFGATDIKLSLFESNYFLRDFDPNSEIDDPQVYYSNQSNGPSSISDALLEGTLLYEDETFFPDARQIRLKNADDQFTGSQTPGLRIVLGDDPDETDELAYWTSKILDKEGEPELSNQNNFNDYFRGIYFKAESMTDDGNLTIFNILNTNANITLFYTSDPVNEGDDRLESSYVINFAGNRVNFLDNDFIYTNGDENLGDEKLFLKGGEGSMAVIKLFEGDDVDNDQTTDNSFELFKKEFVETDDEGNFVKSKKLINEANLVFFVDQTMVNGEEPERIIIYDMKNDRPIVDFFVDLANNNTPVNSRIGHLGRLQRDDNNNGVRYKIRLTEHVSNLLIRDSTNVELGLAVTGNVNLEDNTLQYDVFSSDDDEKVPVSSIITPRGTVLYGNNVLDEEKKLYLEIFFTEPDN
ncbi:DUF4270 domain-containing protein [uncultured Psychroserpens sp.]|uniref:DUF4270 domain-containing protein n=1 Tax=uncultured Psychroserpens sp. TaxID=255436 RepID=UPI00260C7AD0|nr:DUF4270 domain-containing protein [uncultured Psychroserpens sp.]